MIVQAPNHLYLIIPEAIAVLKTQVLILTILRITLIAKISHQNPLIVIRILIINHEKEIILTPIKDTATEREIKEVVKARAKN